LQRETGSAQAELVRCSGRQIVLVIADDRHLPFDTDDRPVGKNLVTIEGLPLASEDADQTRVPCRIDTGGFERLHGAFKKHPLLWIDKFRLACAVVEKRGIEQIESFQRCARPDEARKSQYRIGNTRFAQLFFGKK